MLLAVCTRSVPRLVDRNKTFRRDSNPNFRTQRIRDASEYQKYKVEIQIKFNKNKISTCIQAGKRVGSPIGKRVGTRPADMDMSEPNSAVPVIAWMRRRCIFIPDVCPCRAEEYMRRRKIHTGTSNVTQPTQAQAKDIDQFAGSELHQRCNFLSKVASRSKGCSASSQSCRPPSARQPPETPKQPDKAKQFVQLQVTDRKYSFSPILYQNNIFHEVEYVL